LAHKRKGGEMKRLNPEYIESIKKMVNNCPYFTLISMEIKELGMGKSVLEVQVKEKHLQPFEMVHGGVFSSLMDAAIFWAVYPQIQDGLGLTTVELKINYLAPKSSGSLIARGKTIKIGRTLCLGEGFIEDEDGRLLAHGTETMMILEGLKFKGHEDLPPKFLD